jgi:hypothetical protein
VTEVLLTLDGLQRIADELKQRDVDDTSFFCVKEEVYGLTPVRFHPGKTSEWRTIFFNRQGEVVHEHP